MTTTVKHITFTGRYAGDSICGISRLAIAQMDQVGMHLPYLAGEALGAFVDQHITCQCCRDVFFSCGEDAA